MSLKKHEIVADIATNTGASQVAVEAILDDFAGLVIDEAKKGESISWPALGKFTGKAQAARTAHNPATGGEVQVPAKTVLKFTPGAKTKRQVNGEE